MSPAAAVSGARVALAATGGADSAATDAVYPVAARRDAGDSVFPSADPGVAHAAPRTMTRAIAWLCRVR